MGRDSLAVDAPAPLAAASRLARSLRTLTATALILVMLEFLAGMLINLWVIIPSTHPGANAPEYFSGVARGDWWALGSGLWQLQLHAVIGALLGILSLAILVAAIVHRKRVWLLTALFGWIGVFAAGFNGASFMNYGHEFSSLLMAIGFLLAASAYALGLYATKRA